MDSASFTILALGSRTTDFYLSEINKLQEQKHGAINPCFYQLLDADFESINALLPNPSDQLDAVLQSYMDIVENQNIKHVLVPNITLHETIDRINIRKKIIHPVSLTISKIEENCWSSIVLFGSKHSMQSDYLRAHFQSKRIDVVLPNEEEMLLIDEIRKQIYNGTETTELINSYHHLIHKYTSRLPVVLACTELSILKPENSLVNLVDMASVQIEEAMRLFARSAK